MKELVTPLSRKIFSALMALILVAGLLPVSFPGKAYADSISGSQNVEAFVGESTDSPDGDSSSGVSQPVAQDATQSVFEFIYVDQKTVNLGESQSVVVGFADKSKAPGSELTYQDPNGAKKSVKASKVSDGAALFEIPFNRASECGKYKLVKVSWTNSSNGEAAVPSNDDGYSFEVLQENNSSEDEDAISVYSLNESGEMVEQENLADAIESTAGDSEDNGIAPFALDNGNSRVSKRMVIALDAGHGGSDPGAENKDLKLEEKTLTLKIAQYCKAELDNYAGVTTYMVRSTDEYVGLSERVQRAVNAGANLFVSFHINSAESQATGFEVWVQNDSSWRYELHTQSSQLGNSILSKLSALGLANRGNKESDSSSSKYADGSAADRLAVLRESRMNNIPAVLVEHGFINGKAADQNLLSSEDGLKKMGIADAKGIVQQYGLSKASDSNSEDAKIMGATKATVDQMVRYFESSGHDYPSNVYASKGAASLRDFCQIAYEEAKAEGVRTEVLFCQAMKETGWLQFGGDVRADQCNFGGLGATGNSARGASFSNVREGLRAQVQHLKAYASTDNLVNACVDPRFDLVSRGCAPYLQDLNGKWAVPGDGYGQDILGMIYSLLGESANAPVQNYYTIEDKYSAPASAEPKTVENGEYLIQSALASKSVIRSNGSGYAWETALTLNESDMSSSQKFVFERDAATGFYRIKESKSGKYLGLDESDGKYSPNILLKSYYASDNSLLWKISGANGVYAIKAAVNDGYCLDVVSSSTANGTKIALYAANGTAAQRFSLISTSPKVEGGRTVDDGVYAISVAGGSSRVLDIASSSRADGGNVQVWESNGSAAQRFKVSYDGDGFYSIVNLGSGKALDVESGNLVPGTNVQQWSPNGSEAQKWAIQRNGDGSYRIVSKANGLALGTDGATSANGASIQSWSIDAALSFDFSEAKGQRTVDDGCYIFSSALDSRKVLDVASSSRVDGGNVQLYSSNMSNAQRFDVSYDESTGYYEIKSVASGKALDLSDSKAANGANVQQWEGNGSMAQRWSVESDGDGFVVRSAVNPAYVLDVASGGTANGTNIQVWQANGTAAQRFSLISTEVSTVDKVPDLGLSGWYEVVCKDDSSLCLDVSSSSRSDGGNIQTYTRNGTAAQFFRFDYENGYYRITSAVSGKVLDFENGSVVPGVNLQQWTRSSSDSQRFAVTKDGDSYRFQCVANALFVSSGSLGVAVNAEGQLDGKGYQEFGLVPVGTLIKDGLYSISSSIDSGKKIDVASSSTADGANVQIWDSNNTFAQKWNIEKVPSEENAYWMEATVSGLRLGLNGNNVVQRTKDDSDKSQMWFAEIDPGRGFVFENMGNGLVLDLASSSVANGSNIQTYSRNGTAAQSFNLVQTSAISGGTYVIHLRAGNNQVIDIAGSSTANGGNIQSWSSNDTGAQKWNISDNGDGTYRIANAQNGKVLDVASSNTSPGANIQQYDWNGTAAQRWKISYSGNGSFSIASALGDGLVIGAASANPSDGSNIQLCLSTRAGSQLFSFERTTYTPPVPSDRQEMQNRINGYGSNTSYLIAVDRSTHRVGVFRGSAFNWSLQQYWLCVTGAPATPTITGVYSTTGFKRTSLDTDSRARWCTQIWGGYFFHTILQSESELGNSLSHGCLRMSYPAAQWIYNNIYAGTTVVIYN